MLVQSPARIKFRRASGNVYAGRRFERLIGIAPALMARKQPRQAPARQAKPSSDYGPRWLAPALLLLALGLRLLFWQATADAGWPGSAHYQGDAWVWLDYATALERDQLFELGVPIRPPGMAWLVDVQWSGGLPALWKVTARSAIIGALAVVLFYLAACRAFGFKVGLIVGLLAAGSNGLMVLSTSLNNETPYLLMLAAVFWLSESIARSTRAPALLGWGVLNALACLIRVEHALFFLLALAWLARGWGKSPGGRAGRRAAVAAVATVAAGFGLTLTPWQLQIWRQIDDLNHGPDRSSEATTRLQEAHERALADITWQPAAAAARDRLPAFIRRPSANFVAATVAYRGRTTVTADDFELLEDAFGYVPETLAAYPFIVSTGGLNFLLANHADSAGGFDPAPLAVRPPLAGGAGAYPASFVTGLPPTRLAFSYPGHLRLVNHGYRSGGRWIRQHPGAALELAAKKLAIFWRGATLGLTGWNLPLGHGGLRRAVDLVTPEGSWPAVWRWLLLPLAAWGVVLAWPRPAAHPWLLFLLSKLAVAVLFYGYARQGATTIPVMALLLALVVNRLTTHLEWPRQRMLVAAGVVAGLFLVAETTRFMQHPEVLIDGRPIRTGDVSPDDHQGHTVAFR